MRASCGGVARDHALKWEEVANDTDRLKIPEGFIYRTRAGSLGDPAMVFVPREREPSLVELDQAHRTRGQVLRPNPKPDRSRGVYGTTIVTEACEKCASIPECIANFGCLHPRVTPAPKPSPRAESPGRSCGQCGGGPCALCDN